ncbi:MAG: hypothetical protein PGN13_12325 [Patulibacter minatonensis]
MGTFETALGEIYTVERRLPRMAWRPHLRDPTDGIDGFDVGDLVPDEAEALLVCGVFVLAILLLIFVVPVLLFVAELALIIAIVIPVVLLLISVGLVRHSVVLRAGDGGPELDRRQVRGWISSYRAVQELKGLAASGTYLEQARAALAAETAGRPPAASA